MYASFLRLRATASAWTGLHSPVGPAQGLLQPQLHPGRGTALPANQLRRANSFRDMPSWSSSSHTATGLSFTLDREGRFRFNAACFLPSVSVPSVARTTGASASARLPRPLLRRAFLVGIGRRPCQSGYASLFRFNRAPLPCVRALPLPWELSYGRWQVYQPGPAAVNSSRLDSFLPSPVQMAPSAAQSWSPATGLPEC